jgi:8-oxo-dGTP diphosphatase
MSVTKGQVGIDYPGVSVVCFCYQPYGFVMIKRTNNTRDEHDTWDLVAGKVEHNETAIQALKREIFEEINTAAVGIEFLGYRDIHRTFQGKPDHWIALDFAVLIDPSFVKIGEPEKFSELRWVALNNTPRPLHSQSAIFLSKYLIKLQSIAGV